MAQAAHFPKFVSTRFVLLALAVWPMILRAAKSDEAPIVLRPVSIRSGNRESAFAEDVNRFRQTPFFRAAEAAGVDVEKPTHPLFVHSYRNNRLFYLFYNTVDEAFGDRPYLIQRVKRTIKEYPEGNDAEPTITESYLVEVIKLKNGSFRPDQHFGSYALGKLRRREIVKECEIGFGQIPEHAEGTAWPFESNRLFVVIQDYSPDRTVYDKVRFSTGKEWKIVVSFDRKGQYGVQVPEFGIDAPSRLPDPKAAESAPAADSANLVLLEGRGLLDLVIGKSKATDIDQILGMPLRVERASPAAQNHHYRQRLTCNVYDKGELNTIMTRGGFAGQTSKGIGLRDSLQQVIECYGKTEQHKNSLSYPGVIFRLDAEDRVEQIVVVAGK